MATVDGYEEHGHTTISLTCVGQSLGVLLAATLNCSGFGDGRLWSMRVVSTSTPLTRRSCAEGRHGRGSSEVELVDVLIDKLVLSCSLKQTKKPVNTLPWTRKSSK